MSQSGIEPAPFRPVAQNPNPHYRSWGSLNEVDRSRCKHVSAPLLRDTCIALGGQYHAAVALPPGKRPGTHCIGGWVGPRANLETRPENLDATEIRSPDPPALSESLYRLSYPATIWRAAANILNKQSRRADKGWSSSLWGWARC